VNFNLEFFEYVAMPDKGTRACNISTEFLKHFGRLSILQHPAQLMVGFIFRYGIEIGQRLYFMIVPN
jgi:hypothetical protein